MGIFFTEHILERILQRGITKKAIEYVWQNGLHTVDNNGKEIVTGVYEKSNLKIVARKKGRHTILITTYYHD